MDRLRHAEHVQLDEVRALRVLGAGELLRDLAELYGRNIVSPCIHEDEKVLLVVEGAVKDLSVLVERQRALQLACPPLLVLLLVQVPELHLLRGDVEQEALRLEILLQPEFLNLRAELVPRWREHRGEHRELHLPLEVAWHVEAFREGSQAEVKSEYQAEPHVPSLDLMVDDIDTTM